MQRFTKLFCDLEQTTRTNDKVDALEQYFREAPPEDAAWALKFLSGHTPPRRIDARALELGFRGNRPTGLVDGRVL